MESSERIDFVILWVDGNDKKWLDEKNKYLSINGDSSKNRFRDWENLNYLFRGIEQYASWVNKIFFITWGHVPSWLDTNNPKIRIVKHEEFIPKEYLPTFNSNVIESNLHRIEELSEKFVLFNDDLFILNKLEPHDFFYNGLPSDYYVEYHKKNPSKRHQILSKNYLSVINKYFSKEKFIKTNLDKVLNKNYKKYLFYNMVYCKSNTFLDFLDLHLTRSFLKSTFFEVWEKEKDILDTACKNRFRRNNDIGVTLFRYWQLLNGNFDPFVIDGKYFGVNKDNTELIDFILKSNKKILCINDTRTDIDFEKTKKEIIAAFNVILPNKCGFEK